MVQSPSLSVLSDFYQVPRASAGLLSDGGGPFGFDVHAAVIIDYLVSSYSVDGMFETGCCLGDTTEYLARHYPELPIWTCDIRTDWAAFARLRLRSYAGVTVESGDSAELLGPALASSPTETPLIFLDAHWGAAWPLRKELQAVGRGVVVIDDFDIGDPMFGYDTYDGVRCDRKLVEAVLPDARIFGPATDFEFDVPCLQLDRRAGRAYIAIGLDCGPLERSAMFKELCA